MTDFVRRFSSLFSSKDSKGFKFDRFFLACHDIFAPVIIWSSFLEQYFLCSLSVQTIVVLLEFWSYVYYLSNTFSFWVIPLTIQNTTFNLQISCSIALSTGSFVTQRLPFSKLAKTSAFFLCLFFLHWMHLQWHLPGRVDVVVGKEIMYKCFYALLIWNSMFYSLLFNTYWRIIQSYLR